ncbi:MAG: class I SAM-dependent methyltransferase [Hyphomicrobiales bacterium]|nr:class I SAM-dependent methyltransferase [Hyphomicrobiales bacterium]
MDETVVTGGSPERFGYEWGEYDELNAAYEEQFLRWLPFYKREDWRGKSYLDVGCGMGRNSYWPASYGAKAGLAIDVDDRSLSAAKSTLASFPCIRVDKRSAYEIDETDSFDIVFSIGVIHHLEWPHRALGEMVKAVRPGGEVAIWVYGRENNDWLLWCLNPTRKILFSRMPISWVHFLSNFPTAVLWLALRCGLSRIAYFRLIKTFSFRHLRSIVFDQMLPRIANYWTKPEVQSLMDEAGLKNVELQWVNEMSWAARGCKSP